MQYCALGSSDLKVSAVGLGCWVMGGVYWAEPDDNESVAAVQAALDAGVNFVDTAPAYGLGRSERVLGRAIRGRRDQVVLATKCGRAWKGDDPKSMVVDLSRRRILQEIDDSLDRLEVDVIDLYQCHAFDTETPLEETMTTLARLKEQGKIRHVGVSNFTPEKVAESREWVDIVSVQPHYSALAREADNKMHPYCLREQIGSVVYSPLAQGVLTGKFHLDGVAPPDDMRRRHWTLKPANVEPVRRCLADLRDLAAAKGCTLGQFAIAWTVRQPGVTVAICGARTPEQARHNAAAGDVDLTSDELTAIDACLAQCSEAVQR
jgi:methylglyoxal reductase